MGRGRFDPNAYQQQAKEATASANSGFTVKAMLDEFNPLKVTTRYSKKGPFNEFRDPITVLVGLDVTGSMGIIPKSLLGGKLGSLMDDLKKTYNRPYENLQISFAGIGDAKTDKAPLQVTHFESDNRFAKQLQNIWLEEGGGGNGGESYNLLWWYAAMKTRLNYVKQDGRKGVLITIGDDYVHPSLTRSEIRDWLAAKYEDKDISNRVLIDAAQKQYEIYHIIITNGGSYKPDQLKHWSDLLGQNKVICCKSNDVAAAIADIVKRHRPPERPGMTNLTEEEWSKKNKENLNDEQWVEVLSYTLCPITHQYMEDPVNLDNSESKKCYERKEVEKYPLVFNSNLNIKQLCVDYKGSFEKLDASRKKRLVDLTFPPGPVHVDAALLPYVSVSTSAHVNENASPVNAVLPSGPIGFFAPKPAAAMPSPSASAVIKDSDIPEGFICTISLRLMDDPVFTEDGYTYDRASISKWFEKNSTSPDTNLVIGKKLTPNLKLRSEIMQWKEEQAKKAADSSASAPSSSLPGPSK